MIPFFCSFFFDFYVAFSPRWYLLKCFDELEYLAKVIKLYGSIAKLLIRIESSCWDFFVQFDVFRTEN